MTPALLHEMLADRLNGIEAALARARLGQADAVQALRGHLLDILTLVPRDPGLDAAADDLHRAALARGEPESLLQRWSLADATASHHAMLTRRYPVA